MFSFTDLQSVHVEITNRCQAKCPMCSRNFHGGLPNPLLQETDWSLEDFKNVFDKEVRQQIKKITFCGNFGDPLINLDLINMLDWVKNDKIYIDIHTNGSLRNHDFWKDLPKHLPLEHKVVFAIDGLKDTHSKYRVNTDFEKIINNAQAFIAGGGTAEWSMIRFKHNAHQVELARETAAKLKFKYFTVKDSSRFALENVFEVYDLSNQVIDILEPYKIQQNIDIELIPQLVEQSNIDCWASKQKEVYIDAHLQLMPCCFLASVPYNYYSKTDKLFVAKEKINNQYKSLIKELGNTNLQNKSIKDVISTNNYNTVWKKYWSTKKLYTCARTCGHIVAKPSDQIVNNQQLT